jgi:SAM-dependent methyltransferase
MAQTGDPQPVLAREQERHDRLAATLSPGALPPSPPERWETPLLQAIGDVSGRDVLDVGCGKGDLALWLLDNGARVTGLDLSPGMVDVARERARQFRPDAQARFVATPLESNALPDESFDLVVGRWILHHSDLDVALDEIVRLLRPGGLGIFYENQVTNPVLAFARQFMVGRFGIPRLGTIDEHPFTAADYPLFNDRCRNVELIYPDFYVLGLFDRQVLRYRWPRVTAAIDSSEWWVWRHFPSLRHLSFHVIVRMIKEQDTA